MDIALYHLPQSGDIEIIISGLYIPLLGILVVPQ